jgi:hypothetical protein
MLSDKVGNIHAFLGCSATILATIEVTGFVLLLALEDLGSGRSLLLLEPLCSERLRGCFPPSERSLEASKIVSSPSFRSHIGVPWRWTRPQT